MGGTSWSADDYKARAEYRKLSGTPVFTHDSDVRAGRAKGALHEQMNPYGVKLRESRDSDAHPESRAVAVLCDVTGSMSRVPYTIQENLPKLMGLLLRHGYLQHPQILIGAIGDATCDSAPLQVGQFESGIEIEDCLSRLFLEGGGGCHITESYELAMYFMARHTALDSLQKRGQKGYLFIIGDEIPYSLVKAGEVKRVIGDDLPATGNTAAGNIQTEAIVEELKRLYEVYFVLPRMTSNFDDPRVRQRWTELLGQHVLLLDEPAGICELIASTIGLAEGAVDLDGVRSNLADVPATVVASVSTALAPVAGAAPRGAVATLPSSGAAGGVMMF